MDISNPLVSNIYSVVAWNQAQTILLNCKAALLDQFSALILSSDSSFVTQPFHVNDQFQHYESLHREHVHYYTHI